MKKFRIVALAVALVASAFAFTSASPASASIPRLCIGQGNIVLTPASPATGLSLVGSGGPVASTASGTLGCFVGVEVGGPTVVASLKVSGNLVGHCGRSSGTVTLEGNVGHKETYTLETAGTVLIGTSSTGVVVGNAVADPLVANNSCLNGTAKNFLVTGLELHVN